jgi:hypothetical protein
MLAGCRVRLPWSKIYRAFPELDRFSDRECERFVMRAEQDYPESKVGAYAAGLFIAAVAIVVMVLLERVLWSGFAQRYARPIDREDAQDVVVALSAVFYAVVLCLGVLIARDRWLIRTITRRVHQTSCPGCGYSLLGLMVDNGVIVCPECAAPYFLADHGMTEQDLLTSPGARLPTKAKPV